MTAHDVTPAAYDCTTDEDKDDSIISKALSILQHRLNKGPLLSNPQDVGNYLTLTAPSAAREEFRAVWLDAQHRLIKIETLAVGTINQAAVYPREVVRAALDAQAVSAIVTHNHPSGSLEASNGDRQLTERLKQALALIDVRLLDHIITAGGQYVSLAQLGEI